METNTETILGISPGTRCLGIAILRRDELMDARVKSFKGHWSPEKLRVIVAAMQKLVERYHVTVIVLKRVPKQRALQGVSQLVDALQTVVDNRKIKLIWYSLNDLKQQFFHDHKSTRQLLVGYVVDKNPLLFVEYKKEKQNRNSYYLKMFESIAAAEYGRIKIKR